MRKKKRAIRLTGIVLAVIMIFTMLPISELTAEGNENTDSPVTLSWKPVSENYSVGETGSISLSAKMTAEAEEEPVIVSVSLDKQEAEMLEDFRNDDGSLAERVTADSGQTLTLAQQTDGGYLLSFSLDGEQPELTQSLAISILPDHRTLSRTLEVAEDDVSVTVNGEPVNAVVETGSVSFRSPFGWEVSVDSAGDVLLAEGQSLTDYSVRLTAAPVEDEGRLYTESQEIHMVFTLPEGLSLPEGEYVFDPAAGAVRAGDAEILTVAGLWENAQAQVSRTGSQTLELSLSREQADENTDLSGADLSLRLKGAALQVDLTALGENAQIALNGTVVSDAAGTEDTQEFSASSVISAADTGDSETEMPQEDRQTAEDTEADRTESTRTDSSGESGKIVVETWERLESRNVFWIDNNDEEGKRLQPEEFVPELYFKVDNEEPVKLTADNLDQTGLTQMPEVSVTAVGSGQYRVSADTDLPTRISCRDEYGDLTAGYPKNISWSLNAPDADGYSFREITDENKDDYPSAGETGWYYILYDNFTISITLRSGSFVPDQGGIERAILDHFVLYTRSGGSETYLKLADLADRFVIQVGEDGNTGTITIRDLWRYNMDGTPIIYKVHEADGSADLKVEGMEEGDFYQIVYDNTSVPNYGADTSAVYSGGTIYLVLTGTTDYTATKEWLDSGDTANRPTGELQLWRYREGASYSTAAPVRGSDGSILTVGLDGNDPQSIHFPAESAVVDGETGALPKYDAEGYRYIYVIREYLDGVNQDGQSSDSYEQVYGQVKEDGTVTDTLPSGTVRTSGNTFIYDGGTISNRIQGTVQTSVTKTWEASAFQTEFHDVSVELTLQSRPAGSTDETAWKDVTGSDGKAVTVRMDNFYAESLQASVERNLSKYDALGRELAYRWVETGVYQGEDSEENLLNEDHTFVLKQSGRDIRYLSEASYSEDGLSTSIVNRIANTIDYDIIKIWRDENGEDTLPPEGTTVSFVIYQTLSGETLTDDKIVAEVTMDGVPDEEAVLVNEKLGLTFRETEPWIGKVDFLPEFNEGGAQYEYTLLESGGADHYFPTYETTQSPEDYGYDTTVINAPGDGNRILVRKDWVDDSDVEHRGEITVGVFRRSDGRKVGETTLGDGVWTDWVGIGNLDPEDVYILETEAETDRVYETNAQKLDKDAPEDAVPETHTFETDNHSYEVTYREAMRVQNDVMYSVQNRRLGNINFTVTKTWLDGDGEVRDQLEEALDRLPEEEKITPALRLEFAEEDAQQAGYEISYSGVAQPDTITLGGSHVQIEDQEGNPVSSVQAIDLNGDSSEYYFFNLPKYDTGGDIAHYTVREVWVEEASGQILTLSDLAGSEYQEIYDIVREYQISYGEETYTVSEKHERDTQTLEVINRLSGSKTLTWNKEWNDAYNVKNNIRPDIYLDIYRVVHTGKDTERTELYLANYKWTAAEADTSYDWQVEISGAPKYDDYGYEIIYYAVEKTSVEASDFDYVDTEYRLEGKDNGQTTDLGTEYDPANGAEENEYVIDIQDVKDDDSETETHYALREEGTFVNNIRNSVTIRGYKLWTNLPARYNPENLPGVIFSLMRSTDGGEAEEVATLTIENWAEIAVNGRYVIGFDYEGENTLAVENGQTVITGNGDLLDKYDEAGNLYSYTVQEKEILWKDGMEPEESDGNPVFVISADENTYQLINGYEGVPGKITVKKLLQLPMNDNGAEAYPAVTFRLTRTFTENDGTTSNPETVSEKTISSADVEVAYHSQSSGNLDGRVELICEFADVPRYAPNGSEYSYTVTEVKTNLNGYDTWAAEGDYSLEQWDELTVEANLAAEVAGLTARNDDTVDAAFANAQPDTPETITLNGTKNWSDYGDAFGLRPTEDEFKNSLTLYRSASSQPGQGNQIAETEVSKTVYEIKVTKDPSNSSKWTYSITGTGSSKELERYAPNGMAWKYVLKEDTSGTVYDVTPASVSHGNASVSEGQASADLSPMTNSIKTFADYGKDWADDTGAEIQEDYLGVDLTVNFKLQVAELSGENGTVQTSWTDAEGYFKDNLDDEVYRKVFESASFTASLTGRINDPDSVWKGSFTELPKMIVKKTSSDQVTWLSYRVVETSVEYAGHKQEITVSDGNGGGYSYVYGADGIFQSGKDSYSAGESTAVNKLPTIDFTVTKRWEGDNNNIYGSRPETGRTGHTWEVSFVIQRSTDGTDWENVQVYNGEAVEGEDLIITLYGTDTDTSVSETVSGLPKTDLMGNNYTYRARELQSEDESIVEDDGDIYYDTYQAAYDDDAVSNTTVATNTLLTTKVYAEKNWIGSERTNVTLKLQYLAEDGRWTDLASVTVDGTADADPKTPYYENEAWKAVWSGLPLALAGSRLDDAGRTQYRVTETVPNGYMQVGDPVVGEKEDSGEVYPIYSFTNMKTVSLTVEKNWSVTDRYSKGEITAGIYRTAGDQNPVGVTDADGNLRTVTLNSGGNWKATVNGLPKYDENGNAYTYYARELKEDGTPYDQTEETDTLRIIHSDSQTGENSFATAVRNIERITIGGTKTWQDDGNAYGTRPENLELTLSRNVEGGMPETVAAEPEWTKDGDVWSYEYTGLPYTDDNGNLYTYTVVETVPEAAGNGTQNGDRYESEQDGFDLINTLTGITEVRGTKTWRDGGNEDQIRPDNLTLTLYRQAGENGELEVVANAVPQWSGTDSDTWSYIYSNLPKYNGNGVRYIYSVKETVPDGYAQTEQAGYDLTNTELTSVDVEKIWGVAEGTELPESVTIGLYRTENADGTNLVPVTDADGNHVTVDLNAENGWTETFEDLLKYNPDTGARYYYGIAELSVNGGEGENGSMADYIVHYNGTEETGFVVTNITPISITGTKTWLDNGNAYGTRPDTLSLILSRSTENGSPEVVDAEPKWIREGNTWTYRYENLPLTDDNGNLYTYVVTEEIPQTADGETQTGDRYEAEQDGYDLINTLTGITEVRGTKTWRDGSNADQLRPENLTLTLYRQAGENGELEVVADAVPQWSGTDSDTWSYIYSDLPKYNRNGVRYIYSVKETIPDGYAQTEQAGYDLTNTELTSVDVEKIWGVAEGTELPESVTIGLYRSENADGTDPVPVTGADGNQMTVDLNAENGWTETFEDLLKYNPDTGARYYYGIAELSVNGGEGENGSMADYIVHYNGTEETGFVVTNITPISITGTKTWLDNGNAYGTRPENLELTLSRNVEGGTPETVAAEPEWTKDGDVWTYRYTGLPLTDDAGKVYTYMVEETVPAAEGTGNSGDFYTAAQNGYDLTNTLTGTTEISGSKIWTDNGRTERTEITLNLYANGELYDTQTLKGEGDTWEYAFTDLPKYDADGAVIEYAVREENVPAGYDVYYTENDIENVQQGGLRLTKRVTGAGGDREKEFVFTVILDNTDISGVYGDMLFADGAAEVTLRHGESALAEGLPAGTAYTVTEKGAEADGYTVTSQGAEGEISPGEISEVSFENHKDAVPEDGENVQTGDAGTPGIFVASFVVAVTAALTAVSRRRRRRNR